MNDKMREEFEVWVRLEAARRLYQFMGDLLKRFGEDYATTWVDSAWIGWQASRAELVIVLLPPHTNYEYRDSEVGGACKYYDHAKKSIAAAGVKVSP